MSLEVWQAIVTIVFCGIWAFVGHVATSDS